MRERLTCLRTSPADLPPFTDRKNHVRNYCRGEHDIIDVLVGFPALILVLCMRQPNSDDVLTERFIWQKQLDHPRQ